MLKDEDKKGTRIMSVSSEPFISINVKKSLGQPVIISNLEFIMFTNQLPEATSPLSKQPPLNQIQYENDVSTGCFRACGSFLLHL